MYAKRWSQMHLKQATQIEHASYAVTHKEATSATSTCDRRDVLGALDVPHHLRLLVLVSEARVELGHQLVRRVRLRNRA